MSIIDPFHRRTSPLDRSGAHLVNEAYGCDLATHVDCVCYLSDRSQSFAQK